MPWLVHTVIKDLDVAFSWYPVKLRMFSFFKLIHCCPKKCQIFPEIYKNKKETYDGECSDRRITGVTNSF